MCEVSIARVCIHNNGRVQQWNSLCNRIVYLFFNLIKYEYMTSLDSFLSTL
jgi:hypothetical protein